MSRACGDGASPKETPARTGGKRSSDSAQRKRLGLSAADFGKLSGVTGHTIYSWEHGTSRPRSAQLAAFAAVRALGKTEATARLEEMRALAPTKKKRSKAKGA